MSALMRALVRRTASARAAMRSVRAPVRTQPCCTAVFYRKFSTQFNARENSGKIEDPDAQVSKLDMAALDLLTDTTVKMNINAYNDTHFVVGEERVKGSIIIFPEGFFSLHVKTCADLCVDALRFLEFKRPIPRFLLIGTGKRIERLDQEVIEYLNKLKVTFEILDTPNAIATYNFMNQEGRDVSAVLLAMDPNASLAPLKESDLPPLPTAAEQESSVSRMM